MFNPEIKAKWVAALRSGEYPQCTGALTNGIGGYCCLGVLREIEPKRAIQGAEKAGEAGLLSNDSWTCLGGRTYVNSVFGDPLVQTTLSDMNDCCHSFDEIADFIEKHY